MVGVNHCRPVWAEHCYTVCCIQTCCVGFQVTTHSHLMSSDEVERLAEDLTLAPGTVHSFLLQEFDTELDFSSKVRCVDTHHSRVMQLANPVMYVRVIAIIGTRSL